MAYRWLSPYEAGCHLKAHITSYPEIISYIPPIFNKKQLHTNGRNWKASDFFIRYTLNIIANAVVAAALINPIN